MDITSYRLSPSEQKRTADLMRMAPSFGKNALDVGARDGHFSKLLAQRFESVTALDLTQPVIDAPNVKCVQGNICQLDFPDNSFDFVLCTEVLEHINQLERACLELMRVSSNKLLIGVPYKQDLRFERTTCFSCGKVNPPWGHINSFNLVRLSNCFPSMQLIDKSYLGESLFSTNFLSAWLMNLAGNPYGVYDQDEACIYCGRILVNPPERTFMQRLATRLAVITQKTQRPFIRKHAYWIHLLFSCKRG